MGWPQICAAFHGRCAYCRRPWPRGLLTRDHVVPRAKGGRDGRNIVPACPPCNQEKGSRTVREYAAWLRTQDREPVFLLPGELWGASPMDSRTRRG